MRKRPLDLGISNFDREIPEGTAEALIADPESYASYTGWNFCGRVWVEPDDDRFTCEIWQHGAPVATIRQPTLEDIMSVASDMYGWE